jgi:hypothetical protein
MAESSGSGAGGSGGGTGGSSAGASAGSSAGRGLFGNAPAPDPGSASPPPSASMGFNNKGGANDSYKGSDAVNSLYPPGKGPFGNAPNQGANSPNGMSDSMATALQQSRDAGVQQQSYQMKTDSLSGASTKQMNADGGWKLESNNDKPAAPKDTRPIGDQMQEAGKQSLDAGVRPGSPSDLKASPESQAKLDSLTGKTPPSQTDTAINSAANSAPTNSASVSTSPSTPGS